MATPDDADRIATATRRVRDARKRKTAPRKRTSAPPQRVEPGWIHEAMSAALLRLLADRSGGQVKVGEITDEFMARVPGAEDGDEPAVLLARVLAHVGHRLPLVKRFEKRLEGRELRSGLGSDALALAAQLYIRNRDLVPVLVQLVTAQRDKTSPETPASDGGGEPAAPAPFFMPGAPDAAPEGRASQ